MSNSSEFALEDVLDAAIGSWIGELHTAMAGQIVEYDQASRRATVQPLVRVVLVDGDGNETRQPRPPITDVPVLMVGSGKERIRFPIAAGDECLIIATSDPLAGWKQSGGVSDPVADRRHHLADAIAIVGLAVSQPADGPVIAFTDDAVAVGAADATEPALRGQAFVSALSTLVSAISTAIGAIIPGGGGAAAATAINGALSNFNAAASSYLSGKVKIQ